VVFEIVCDDVTARIRNQSAWQRFPRGQTGRRWIVTDAAVANNAILLCMAPKRNLILQHSSRMPYFTNIRLVFEALPGVCVAHDGLISGLECTWFPTEDDDVSTQPDERFATTAVLLNGLDLHRIVSSNEIQFDWAVFSALPIGSQPNMGDLPIADGNPDFWRGSPKPQLTEAEFEIVCWDNCCVLLIGVGEELADRFRTFFPETLALDDYNQRIAIRPRRR
jgi:hypothetical protein